MAVHIMLTNKVTIVFFTTEKITGVHGIVMCSREEDKSKILL